MTEQHAEKRTEKTATEARAGVTGHNVRYVLGASLGPVGTGMLSDHFAHQAMRDAGAGTITEAFKAIGLHHAMYVIPALAVAASLVLFAASRTVTGDIRKQERNHQA